MPKTFRELWGGVTWQLEAWEDRLGAFRLKNITAGLCCSCKLERVTSVIVSAIEDGSEWPVLPAIRVVPQSLALCLYNRRQRAFLIFIRHLTREIQINGGNENESFGKGK